MCGNLHRSIIPDNKKEKEYLYVYLMEIFHEKKDLKEIGFFKSVKDIPLDKQEQIEVKKYIIDTKDFDIRLISLIAVEER